MRLLNGRELAEYIKQRQVKDVRSLKQAHGVTPKLAILVLKDDPIINLYVGLKQRYGKDIGADVEVHTIEQKHAAKTIEGLNADDTVHGIIVQLPVSDPTKTDEIVNLVAPQKDVDALGADATLDPATPTAILWLLAGYNVDLKNKNILLIGKGKLVGQPLEKMLKSSGHNVTVATRSTQNLADATKQADIIVTATGSPAILYSNMIKEKAVVVDAGVAGEDGKTVGDLADDVYERDDLTLTPKKGGVGPLTVCALFENVIKAAQQSIKVA